VQQLVVQISIVMEPLWLSLLLLANELGSAYSAEIAEYLQILRGDYRYTFILFSQLMTC